MGIVTDIQRFSLHDGPGIRTSVFLKGCNVSCAWCHNPETIRREPQLHFYPEKCAGCGACFPVCPTGARTPEGLERARCTGCGACARECFFGALMLSGREMSARDVMDEVLQDEVYYRRSGGGVTVTGGEVLCQAAFAAEILTACREKGIGTAIETNLAAPWAAYEKILPLCDVVMFDIKLFDEAAHKRHVGVSNRQVLENAGSLGKAGKRLIARTPVIPGVNDTEKEIAAIAAFLKDVGVEYYELLNFNPLGESKYESLGLQNAFAGARPLSAQSMEELATAARASGLEVRVG